MPLHYSDFSTLESLGVVQQGQQSKRQEQNCRFQLNPKSAVALLVTDNQIKIFWAITFLLSYFHADTEV